MQKAGDSWDISPQIFCTILDGISTILDGGSTILDGSSTIFCRFSPFFIDFHDLRTFVAIYILSRFTHFFRNFFLAKIAFSATSHVFCMYAAWFILVFRTHSCLLPCLKVENKKDISGLRSMWGCRVWGRNRARWAIISTILKWAVATILHASSTYSFRYPLVHNPSLFSFSKICSSFSFSLSIREQTISLSENLLLSLFFSLHPSHTKHFPFLPNFTSFSFCIITTD